MKKNLSAILVIFAAASIAVAGPGPVTGQSGGPGPAISAGSPRPVTGQSGGPGPVISAGSPGPAISAGGGPVFSPAANETYQQKKLQTVRAGRALVCKGKFFKSGGKMAVFNVRSAVNGNLRLDNFSLSVRHYENSALENSVSFSRKRVAASGERKNFNSFELGTGKISGEVSSEAAFYVIHLPKNMLSLRQFSGELESDGGEYRKISCTLK